MGAVSSWESVRLRAQSHLGRGRAERRGRTGLHGEGQGNGAVPDRRNGRSNGREAGKHLRRKFVGGSLLEPDCDLDGCPTHVSWAAVLTIPQTPL